MAILATSPLLRSISISSRSSYAHGILKSRSSLCRRHVVVARTVSASSIIEDRLNKLPKLIEDVVQTSVSTGPRGILRLTQGIQATLVVGSEFLSELSKNVGSSRVDLARLQFGLLSPIYLRRWFESMGATYIKLGQFIASTPTIFPAEYVEEFQKCFDKVPPVSYNEIKAVLEQELKQPLESIYDYIDPVPIASASIAQVHSARLSGSGEEVVIKVLKPGIKDFLIADLNFLYVCARILEFLNPEVSRTSLVSIIGDIRESMLEEVDFVKEAANIEAFRGYLERNGLTRQATAPRVFYHCSTQRVLTMERLYGIPLTDLESMRPIVSSPEESLITALNVWFGSILASESFHADVHAGNLWLLRDGRIGFLDFGIVGKISPKTWNAVQTFLTSVAVDQYEAMAASLVQMGATNDTVDIQSFARDLENIFSTIKDIDSEIMVSVNRGSTSPTISANMVVDDKQMNALFLNLVNTSESYGLKFPREFALLIKQFLYFDRYTRLLAPQLNMFKDDRITLRSNERNNFRNTSAAFEI